MSDLECIQSNDDCQGKVEYREPLSGTGKAFPRCEHHWELRLIAQADINRRYGSPSAPPDFDPSYAGETWEDEA